MCRVANPQSTTCDIGAYEKQPSDLSLTKSVDPTSAAPGDTITYTLTFSNAGNATASGVVITDTLPVSITNSSVISSGVAITQTASSYVWDVQDLAPGEGGTITITGQVSSSLGAWTGFTNTAVIATTSAESDLTNNSASASLQNCNNLIVSNADDSGSGSLRQAISDACDGATITFADDYTIYLNSTLQLAKELTIDGSGQSVTVSGNDAVRVFEIQSNGVVTLSYMTVVSGTASAGGGIYNAGALTVQDNAFSGNSAVTSPTSAGGGIANNGTLTVRDSTFSGNSAAYGGGIVTWGTAVLTNTTIVSNTAIRSGGGIYNWSGVLTLTNSIVAYSGSGGDCASSSIVDNGYNLDSDNTCGLSAAGSITNTDPLLAPLGDYGGETQTHALLPGSPAIDAGNNAACDSADQRGESRSDWTCDIGAYEMQFADSDTVSKTVSGGNTYTFGPTLAKVAVDDDGGCLTALSIQRLESDHPNATSSIQTGRYWAITPTSCSSGFTVTLTLPYTFTASSDDRLCRYTGSDWDCGQDADNSAGTGPTAMPDVMIRQNVTQLSDWALSNGQPTAITLASLTATPASGGVLLTWETSSEVDLLGFHLYRAEAADGPQVRLNETLISAQIPGSPAGAVYTWPDEAVMPGLTYYYWLEAVDVYGSGTRHGPVWATAGSGQAHTVYLPLVLRQSP